MNKHGFAIAFAIIGSGVGGFIMAESEGHSFIPVIIGLCLGAFVGYFFTGLRQAKGNILQQNFQKLGDLRGKQLSEIESKVGTHNSFKSCTITDRNNAPGYLYTWLENNYSITLLFDADNNCIGVNSETKI